MLTAARSGARTERTSGGRNRLLTWLTVLLAVPAPVVIVVALMPRLERTGEVSHWPWEEHGFFGWWLIPAAFALAGVASAARRPGRRRTTILLLAVAAATALALFYNP